MAEEIEKVGTLSSSSSQLALARPGSDMQECVGITPNSSQSSPNGVSVARVSSHSDWDDVQTTSPVNKGGPGLRLLPFDALVRPRPSRRFPGIPYHRLSGRLGSLRLPHEDRAHASDHQLAGAAVSATHIPIKDQFNVRRRFQPYPSHTQNDRYDLGRLDFATINSPVRDSRTAWSPKPDRQSKSQSPDFSYFSPHAPTVSHQRTMSPSVLTYRDASLRPYLRRAETALQLRPAMVMRTYSDNVLSMNTSYAQSPLSPYDTQIPYRSSAREYDVSNDYSTGFQNYPPSIVSETDSMAKSTNPKQVMAGTKVDKGGAKTGKIGRPSNRSRSTGNMCQSCNATTTPEWRKGPTGPRSLCNACGLLYAKMCRKNETDAVLMAESKHEDTEKARQVAIDELNKPGKQQQFLEALRAGVRAAAHSKSRVQTGSTLEAGTPVSSSAG